MSDVLIEEKIYAHIFLYLGDEEFIEAEFCETGFDRVRSLLNFNDAVAEYAKSRLKTFAAFDADIRWLTKDIARTAIYYAALVRDSVFGNATVGGLCLSAKRDRVCSRGRVLAWVERAMKLGLIHVSPGHEAWTQRRLILDPRLGDAIAMRIRFDVAALADLAPELRDACEIIWPDDALKIFLSTLLELAFRKPEIISGTPMPITQLMHLEAGMEFLGYLIVQGGLGEAQHIDDVRVAMSDCAQQIGVSRAHLYRLLDTVTAAGLLAPAGDHRVRVTPLLHDNLAWVVTANVQLYRLFARRLIRRVGGANR
jgi:hypothetical protein